MIYLEETEDWPVRHRDQRELSWLSPEPFVVVRCRAQAIHIVRWLMPVRSLFFSPASCSHVSP